MGKKEYQQNLHNPAKSKHNKANRMLHRNEGDRLGSWRRASPTVTAVRHARRTMSDHRGRSGAGAVAGANWLVLRFQAWRATKGDTARLPALIARSHPSSLRRGVAKISPKHMVAKLPSVLQWGSRYIGCLSLFFRAVQIKSITILSHDFPVVSVEGRWIADKSPPGGAIGIPVVKLESKYALTFALSCRKCVFSDANSWTRSR